MMFLTPGTSFTPRCTACETIFFVTLTVTLPTPGMVFSWRLTCLRIGSMLALRRIAEQDVDDDVVAVDVMFLRALPVTKSRPVLGSVSALQCWPGRLLR